MLKRLSLALAGLFALTASALGAGTIPFSLSQQFDSLGHPLAACKLYTIQAGTTSTPQNAYQDSALTLALPNPQICDSAGRLPQMFLADGTIKVRLTDRNGVTQIVADNILVVGASSGGGGGGTVDPTTIITTGDIKPRYGTGVIDGFVRANGRTIGSATSGASERANADCQTLFEYLWNAGVLLTVSGGRGASANADWVANKTITLPDFRGATLAGLADMGNSATTVLTSTYFGTDPTNLGAAGGGQSKTLLTANLPAYTPAGSLSLSTSVTTSVSGTASVSSTNSIPSSASWSTNGFCCVSGSANVPTAGGGAISYGAQASTGSITASASSSASSSGSFTGSAQGGTSTPFATVPPMVLVTVYVKL